MGNIREFFGQHQVVERPLTMSDSRTNEFLRNLIFKIHSQFINLTTLFVNQIFLKYLTILIIAMIRSTPISDKVVFRGVNIFFNLIFAYACENPGMSLAIVFLKLCDLVLLNIKF